MEEHINVILRVYFLGFNLVGLLMVLLNLFNHVGNRIILYKNGVPIQRFWLVLLSLEFLKLVLMILLGEYSIERSLTFIASFSSTIFLTLYLDTIKSGALIKILHLFLSMIFGFVLFTYIRIAPIYTPEFETMFGYFETASHGFYFALVAYNLYRVSELRVRTIQVFNPSHFLPNSRTIKPPPFLRKSLQQYLLFFPEYVKSSKGEKIEFDVTEVEDDLEIKFNLKRGQTLEQLGKWFDEFMGFVHANLSDLKVNFEIEATPRDADILIAQLKVQVTHLSHGLELEKLKAHYSEKEADFLKELTFKMIAPPQQKKIIIQTESEIDEIRQLTASGDLKAAIEDTYNLFSKSRDRRLNEVIAIQARFNRLSEEHRTGTISNSDYHLKINSIQGALLELLDN